jgi:hypothetical protein
MAQVHHVLTPRDIGAELWRWSLRGPMDWREWDHEFVVRAGDTGATYLLSALAGEALMALRDGARYLDEIAAQVLHDSTPLSPATAALVATFADPGDDAKVLLAVLTELESLGLARAELA